MTRREAAELVLKGNRNYATIAAELDKSGVEYPNQCFHTNVESVAAQLMQIKLHCSSTYEMLVSNLQRISDNPRRLERTKEKIEEVVNKGVALLTK